MQNTDGYRDLSRSRAIADVADAELLSPQDLLLGRYRALRTLGVGGNGTVFLAWDEQLTRHLAIKEILLDQSVDSSLEADALHEARAAATLSHPNIITVHDFIHLDNAAYIIMEYLEGVSLADLKNEDLSSAEMAHIIKSLAAALSYGHKNGVLHLDVKPSNVIINAEGQVKLIDFGVAKLASAVGSEHASGGTLGYMPLEQMEGKPVSKLSDEWSFAALVYELYFGEIPYENKMRFADIDELIQLQRESEPELLLSGNEFFDAALARALHVEPAFRFGSVKSFADEILPTLDPPAQGKKSLKARVADLIGDEVRTKYDGADDSEDYDRGDFSSLWLFSRRLLLSTISFIVLLRFIFDQGLIASSLAGVLVVATISLIIGISPILGSILSFGAASLSLMLVGDWLIALPLLIIGFFWWLLVGRLSKVSASFGLLVIFAFLEMSYALRATLIREIPAVFPAYMWAAQLILAGSFILISALVYWIHHRRNSNNL